MRQTTRIHALALAGLFLAPSIGATDLEALAERLDRLEKKVEAYEKRFGPLEKSNPQPAADSKVATFGELATPERPWSVAGQTSDGSDEVYSEPTAFSGNGWWDRTHLGGYGEMHLNIVSGDDNEIDFHRWVLFLNHRFSDRITLNSELELEHSLAGDGKNGEVELEQAYIDIALGGGVHAQGGLFLLPVGLLNEHHEPETFFGVERNGIEKEIIPTTWWEGGVGIRQTLESGFDWHVQVHSGLNVPTTGANAYRIRSGRQKVSEAPANDPAVTARLRYRGIPGLELSVFGSYQSDITQVAGTEDNEAILVGGTATFTRGGFGLRALIAGWDIDGTAVAAMNRDSQWGYYVEPSYTFNIDDVNKLGVFTRWSSYEYALGDYDVFNIGLNYWPHDNVVFKLDYQHAEKQSGSSEESVNLGVGYSF